MTLVLWMSRRDDDEEFMKCRGDTCGCDAVWDLMRAMLGGL